MKLLTTYRIALWLLIACVLAMGTALKHAQNRATLLQEQLRASEEQNVVLQQCLQLQHDQQPGLGVPPT